MPEAVKELLEGNSNSEAVQLLTATYDGGPTSCTAASVVDDDDFLFRGANPVLHAARLGNPGMVTTVLQALRTRVSSQKVKSCLIYSNRKTNPTLYTAVLVGGTCTSRLVLCRDANPSRL